MLALKVLFCCVYPRMDKSTKEFETNLSSHDNSRGPRPSSKKANPDDDICQEPSDSSKIVKRITLSMRCPYFPGGESWGKWTSEECASRWSWRRLLFELTSSEQCIAFAEQHNLIARVKKCIYHDIPMKITPPSVMHPFGVFQCPNPTCLIRICRTTDTWFENTKLKTYQIFDMMYAFSLRYSVADTIREVMREEDDLLSEETVNDFFIHCYETVVVHHLRANKLSGSKIGGRGVNVRIDMCKFSKRKYNKGRDLEGKLLIEITKVNCSDLILELCGNTVTSEELALIVQQHVRPGSVIHTNANAVYARLADHGYSHVVVSESDREMQLEAAFDNPDIKPPQWRFTRRYFEENDEKSIADQAVVYHWRKTIIGPKRVEPFIVFIGVVEAVYGIRNEEKAK